MKLEVISNITDEVEAEIEFKSGELELPGYLEFVERQYEGTVWRTRRVLEEGDEEEV